MKAITLKQPWASLFVAGAKLIETRSWSTKHRGIIAVHASAKISRADALLCLQQPFAGALAALGLNTPADLPVGAILGTVELVDCLPMVRGPLIADCWEFPIDDPRLGTQERGQEGPMKRKTLTVQERAEQASDEWRYCVCSDDDCGFLTGYIAKAIRAAVRAALRKRRGRK